MNNVNIEGQPEQPSASWIGKKPKASTSSSSSKPDKASIFEDFIEGNPEDTPISTGPVKPPTISMIERVEVPRNPAQNPQRAPKKEDFPSLAAPSSSKRNNNHNSSSALSGWSKVTAPEPEVKAGKGKNAKQNKNKPQNGSTGSATGLEKKVERLNLNDGKSFPSLAMPEAGSSQSQKPGAWGVSVPVKGKKDKISNNSDPNPEFFIPPTGSQDQSSSSNGNYFFQFIFHKNDEKRMGELLKSVRIHLSSKNRENNIPEFKRDWICFQNSGLSAKELFQRHLKLLGSDFYENILCDVVTLTPNISQQHSFNNIWQEYYRFKQNNGQADSGPNRNAPHECDVCAQFILPSEKAEHSRFHSQSGLTGFSNKNRRK